MSTIASSSAKGYELSKQDQKEVAKVSNYAVAEAKRVQNLSEKFKNKGSIGLWWDRKVPQKDKRFYYFISLSESSNRDVVLSEIQKYREFYDELIEALDKVEHAEKRSESEDINPQIIILELNKKLSKMAKAAVLGEDTISSSALYKLHKSFIEKHEMLENMIKRVECIAVTEGLKKAKDGWLKSIETIDELKAELRSARDDSRNLVTTMASKMEKYDMIMEQNQQLMKQQKELLANNEILQDLLEKLLQENLTLRNYS